MLSTFIVRATFPTYEEARAWRNENAPDLEIMSPAPGSDARKWLVGFTIW